MVADAGFVDEYEGATGQWRESYCTPPSHEGKKKIVKQACML
jgi:hypothetical protein